MAPFRYFLGVFRAWWGLVGVVTIVSYILAPYAIIPEPSVVYDGVYGVGKSNGREYDWWAVT